MTDQVPCWIAMSDHASRAIQVETSSCSARIGSLRNVRVILPASSVKQAT